MAETVELMEDVFARLVDILSGTIQPVTVSAEVYWSQNIAYKRLPISSIVLGKVMIRRWWVSWGRLRRRWSVSPSDGWCSNSTVSTEDFLLASCLLVLKSRCSCFDQSILDTACDFSREHRPRIQWSWDRFFPRF